MARTKACRDRAKLFTALAKECVLKDKVDGLSGTTIRSSYDVSNIVDMLRVENNGKVFLVVWTDPATGERTPLTIEDGDWQIALTKKDPLLPFTEENTIVEPRKFVPRPPDEATLKELQRKRRLEEDRRIIDRALKSGKF
jgi:hypothetical protein